MFLKVQPLKQILLYLEGVRMYIYNQLKNGEKKFQQLEEEQKYFKNDLNEVTGNPKHKTEKQSYTIKNVKNIHDSRQKNY